LTGFTDPHILRISVAYVRLRSRVQRVAAIHGSHEVPVPPPGPIRAMGAVFCAGRAMGEEAR